MISIHSHSCVQSIEQLPFTFQWGLYHSQTKPYHRCRIFILGTWDKLPGSGGRERSWKDPTAGPVRKRIFWAFCFRVASGENWKKLLARLDNNFNSRNEI